VEAAVYRPQTAYYNSIEQGAAALLLCCNVVLRRRFQRLAECEARDKTPIRVTVQMAFTGC
jgi:hypothetical protein